MDYKEASAKYRKAWKGEIPGHAGDPEYIDYSKLVTIGSGGPNRKVITSCAEAYNNMRQATYNKWSFEVGVSTFRPLAGEIKICNDNPGRCDGKSKAAPGNSRHGWGRAIDFTLIYSGVNGKLNTLPTQGTSAFEMFNWLCENALSYGFVNYLAEAWHWEFVGIPPGIYNNPACIKDSGAYNGATDSVDGEKGNTEGDVSTNTTDDNTLVSLNMNDIWNNTNSPSTVNITNEGTNNKPSESNPEILTILNPDKKALSGQNERDKQIIDIPKK